MQRLQPKKTEEKKEDNVLTLRQRANEKITQGVQLLYEIAERKRDKLAKLLIKLSTVTEEDKRTELQAEIQTLRATVSDYDVQGVASIQVSKAEIEAELKQLDPTASVSQYFPNKLTDGVEVLFYKEGYKPYPPILQAIEQRAKLFCAAAVKLNPKLSLASIKSLLLRIKMEAMEELCAFEELDSSKIKKMLYKYSGMAIVELHGLQKFPRENLVRYGEKLKKIAFKTRASESSVLTFNMATKTFSLDLAQGATTAHDKNIGSDPSNLSYGVDGVFSLAKNQRFLSSAQTTNAVVRFASPTATSAIKQKGKMAKWVANIGQKFAISPEMSDFDFDILMDECCRWRKIIDFQRDILKVGQSGKSSDASLPKPHGCYQLLTTNAFDHDYEEKSYDSVVQSTALMRNFAHIDVFNAGINTLAKLQKMFGKKADKSNQRVENRKAYIELTDALSSLKFPAASGRLERRINGLKTSMTLNGKDKQNYDQIAALHRAKQEELADISKEIWEHPNGGPEAYVNNLKEISEKEKKLKDMEKSLQKGEEKSQKLTPVDQHYAKGDIAKLKKEIEELKQKKRGIKKQLLPNVNNCKKLTDKAGGLREITLEMENIQKKHHEEKSYAIVSSIKDMEPEIQKFLSEQIYDSQGMLRPSVDAAKLDTVKNITALIYKAYADKLYYSGKYLEPEYAGLFNACLLIYQEAAGLMPMTGCKSANDRTFYVRLLHQALAMTPIFESGIFTIPNLKPRDSEILTKRIAELAMAHSSILACFLDNGGSPKSGQFKGYAGVDQLGEVERVFASEAMKSCKVDAYIAAYTHGQAMQGDDLFSQHRPRADGLVSGTSDDEFKPHL